MKSRVHPKYKTKYRVKSWASYDRALVRRGDVNVWLSPEAIATWKPAGVGVAGDRSFSFSHRASPPKRSHGGAMLELLLKTVKYVSLVWNPKRRKVVLVACCLIALSQAVGLIVIGYSLPEDPPTWVMIVPHLVWPALFVCLGLFVYWGPREAGPRELRGGPGNASSEDGASR